MEATPWSKVEATRWEQSGGDPVGAEWRRPMERSRGTTEAQPRRGATLPCKTRRTGKRRTGVEQGEATAWSMARRRGGAKWKAHRSAAADRVDAVPACRCHTNKAAALHARQDGKSASNPTGCLQGIPSGCLQSQLRRSTVRRPPCRGESRPVNARGPLDVAGLSSPGPLTGQSFHACARPSGDGASPTPRPAWP